MPIRIFAKAAVFAMVFGTVVPAFAQQERDGERPDRPDREGRERGEGRDGGRGGFGGRGFGGRGGFGGGDFNPADMMRRLNPMFAAIDKDEDGTISAAEIQGAVAALQSLDTDGDGAISAEEVRPQFGRGGPGGGPGGFGGPPGGGPGGGFPGRGGPPRGEGMSGPNPFLERMKELDKDGDGSLSREELGDRADRMLEFGDTNSDGKIDKAEMEQMANRAGGGRGGRGGRPGGEGGRPGGPGGERPARPESE